MRLQSNLGSVDPGSATREKVMLLTSVQNCKLYDNGWRLWPDAAATLNQFGDEVGIEPPGGGAQIIGVVPGVMGVNVTPTLLR
jgi:hypothetical protein